MANHLTRNWLLEFEIPMVIEQRFLRRIFQSENFLLVSLKTDEKDKYKVYIENFERAYLNETTRFYKQKAGQYLAEHGILAYLHYADLKLKVRIGWTCSRIMIDDAFLGRRETCETIFGIRTGV